MQLVVGARQNATQLDLKISADTLCIISVEPWLNYSDSLPAGPVFALLCSIQLRFAADWRQLATSYPVWL